jgi:hypothetical protein
VGPYILLKTFRRQLVSFLLSYLISSFGSIKETQNAY